MSNDSRDPTPWAADLVFAAVVTVLGALTVWVDLGITPIRILVAVSLVLVLPGYAFVSALFPAHDSRASYPRRENRPLGFLERLALGVLASAIIVPFIAFMLNFTPYGITIVPLLLVVTGVTLFFLLVAFLRRLRVPVAGRYRVPLGAVGALPVYLRVAEGDDESSLPLAPRSGTHLLLNVILVVSMVILLASVGYAVVSPPSDDGFTEFYLVMEDEEGEYVAHGYPETLGEAQGQPVHVAIENEEGTTIAYTVVVAMQVVEGEGQNAEVTDTEVLDQFDVTVAHGEGAVTPYELSDAPFGEDSRLVFLLYRGEPPSDPSPENADRLISLDFTE